MLGPSPTIGARTALSLAIVAAIAVFACGRAPDGGVEGAGGAPLDLEGDHEHYLRSVEGARLELVEPGTDGAWREIRGAGRVVRLAAPPERIASRTLATDEILLEIAEPERIVLLSPFAGDPQFSASADKAKRLGRVGGFSTEELLAASPDLVFAAGFNTQETLAQLEAAGVPVVVLLDHEDLAAIERNIRTVGFATGRDREAERLVESMRQRLEEARARAGSKAEGLRVVHWSGGVVLGGRTVFDDALRYLGAVNLAAENGLEGWPRISAEQVVIWDPDVIFTDSYVAGDVTPGALDGTRAARLGNLESLDGRDMAAISHHVAGMVERLADALVRASGRIEEAGRQKRVAARE
ncbi:MAG: ABC transporter substrate-binding protein [Holophagales bacterium]|nr:ABC transporter substrate-binding protein [Holophagales bacterium]